MASEVTSQETRPRLAVQAGWLLIAKVIGFVISFVAPLIIVRALDQKEFGLYKQAFLIFGTAVPLLTLAFYMNVFYFLPRRPAEGPKIVLNILIVHAVTGLAALLVLLFYPAVLRVLFGNDDLIRYGPLLGFALFLTIFGYFVEVVATANQDVAYSTAFIIAAQLTKGVAMVTAALVAGTLRALLYAAVVQGIVQSGVMLWYLRKRFSGFLGRPDWTLMGEQLRYAVPLGIAGVASLVFTDLPMYIVAHQFSPAEYAIFAVGCFQLPLIGLLRESANAVMMARVSYLQQRDETHRIVMLLASAMRKLSLVYWPTYVFITISAWEFITLLYTSRYSASVPIFVINIVAVPFAILMSDCVFRAYAGSATYLLKLRLVETVLVITGVYAGIHYFGMRGAITAVVVAVLIDYFACSWKAARLLCMNRHDIALFSDLGKVGGCALLAGAVTVAARQFFAGLHPFAVLLSTGVIFSATYAAAVLGFGVPTGEEIDLVRNKVVQVRRALRAA